jgi:CubicO group peptidase (beta-lactamase class C family)
MPATDIPGLAVSVVQDGKVIIADGFGVTTAGSGQPVSGDTLFMIGSGTKTFIAAGIADFVDRGTVHWDTPVREVLPDFKSASTYLARFVTIGDLLAHRTGLGDYVGDGLWELGSFGGTEASMLQRLISLEPTLPLGTTSTKGQFQYSNVGYALATACLEALANASWHQYLRDRFWRPLHMNSTFGSPALVPEARRAQLAAGHGWCMLPNGTVDVRPFDLFDAATPTILGGFTDGAFGAGSAVMSAADYATWMRFLLGGCTPLMASPAACQAMQRGQGVAPYEWIAPFLPPNDANNNTELPGRALGVGYMHASTLCMLRPCTCMLRPMCMHRPGTVSTSLATLPTGDRSSARAVTSSFTSCAPASSQLNASLSR